MLSSLRRSSTVAMLAALAFAGGSVPVLATQPAMTSSAPRSLSPRRLPAATSRRGVGLYGRKGAGISTAQLQRASRKKRGVARNRVNHR